MANINTNIAAALEQQSIPQALLQQLVQDCQMRSTFIGSVFENEEQKSQFVQLLVQQLDNVDAVSLLRLLSREKAGLQHAHTNAVVASVGKLGGFAGAVVSKTNMVECGKACMNLLHMGTKEMRAYFAQEFLQKDCTLWQHAIQLPNDDLEVQSIAARLVFYCTIDESNCLQLVKSVPEHITTMNKFAASLVVNAQQPDSTALALPFFSACVQDLLKMLINVSAHLSGIDVGFTLFDDNLKTFFSTLPFLHDKSIANYDDLARNSIQVMMFAPVSFVVNFFTVAENDKVAANYTLLLVYNFLLLKACCDEQNYSTEVTPILATLTTAVQHSEIVRQTLDEWILQQKWPSGRRPQLPEALKEMIKRKEYTEEEKQKAEEEAKKRQEKKKQKELEAAATTTTTTTTTEEPQSDLSAQVPLAQFLQENKFQGDDDNSPAEPHPELFDAPDMEYNDIKSVFVRLMTSSNYNAKTYAAEFLFELCAKNVERFVAETGVGNALGVLAEKNLLGALMGNQ